MAFSLVLCPGHRKIGKRVIHGLTKEAHLWGIWVGEHEPECPPSKSGPELGSSGSDLGFHTRPSLIGVENYGFL